MTYFAVLAAMIGARTARLQAIGPIFLFGLFVFIAFRFEIGCDWVGYDIQYRAGRDTPDQLWDIFLALHSAIGANYLVLNLTTAAIFLAGLWSFARREPDIAAILILTFPFLIINIPMSGIRQAAAMGVIFFALNAFQDRRLVKFVALVVLAGSIHSSAMMFLLAAPFTRGGVTRRRMFGAAFLVIPIYFALANSGAIELATNRYLDDSTIESYGGPYRVALLAISAIYYFLFLRPYWVATGQRGTHLADVGAIGMIMLPFLIPISTLIADRLGYYFIPIQAMIFARTAYLPLQRNRALLVLAPYVVLIGAFVVYTLTSTLFEQCYLPYRTWLFGVPATRFDGLAGY